jgi:hypothetical protein
VEEEEEEERRRRRRRITSTFKSNTFSRLRMTSTDRDTDFVLRFLKQKINNRKIHSP